MFAIARVFSVRENLSPLFFEAQPLAKRLAWTFVLFLLVVSVLLMLSGFAITILLEPSVPRAEGVSGVMLAALGAAGFLFSMLLTIILASL